MMLLTKEIKAKLPPIHGQEGLGEDAVVYVKFFTPDSNWTWYVTEGGPALEEGDVEVDYEFFGLVDGFEQEWGYFNLSELQNMKGPMGLGIERDLYWKPMTVRQVRQIIQRNRPEPEAEALRAATDNVLERVLHEEFEVEAEGGEKVTLVVHDTAVKADLLKYGRWLESAWCTCKQSKFLCYPGDGECTCGVEKHHVHCANCGGVSQVG